MKTATDLLPDLKKNLSDIEAELKRLEAEAAKLRGMIALAEGKTPETLAPSPTPVPALPPGIISYWPWVHGLGCQCPTCKPVPIPWTSTGPTLLCMCRHSTVGGTCPVHGGVICTTHGDITFGSGYVEAAIATTFDVNALSEICTAAMTEVRDWPEWKRSDYAKREFPELYAPRHS